MKKDSAVPVHLPAIETIYDAKRVLAKVLRRTALIPVSRIEGPAQLFLKPENLQVTGSFKVRGAYYKISKLSEEERKRGVVACSAGNHAQGVALAAQINNIKAAIFMPKKAPIAKVEATRRYGAEIVLVDGVYDDAHAAACAEVEKSGAVMVHPFNDPFVIAGQGTIGMEILEDFPEVEAVVVPIGGGGLASGIAMAIKTLKPSCKVYGVQAEGAPAMANSFHVGKLCGTKSVKTFADGIAVKMPGSMTWEICRKYLDDIVTVEEGEASAAVLSLLENQKLITEGAGAIGFGAVLYNKLPLTGKKVVCVTSGGNIDVTILDRVIKCGLLKTGRLMSFLVVLQDQPGELNLITKIVSDFGANITEISQQRGYRCDDINGCLLRMTLETRDFAHCEQIRAGFQKYGYTLHIIDEQFSKVLMSHLK